MKYSSVVFNFCFPSWLYLFFVFLFRNCLFVFRFVAVAPIGVFWVTDDCGIPIFLDFFKVSENIKRALYDCNHRGSVEIIAYGQHEKLGVPPFAGGEIEFQGSEVVFSPFAPGEF